MEGLDLRQLVQIVIKRWWIIAVCTLVSAIIAGIVSFFFIEPVYQSSTTLYIGKKTDQKNEIAYNDILLDSQLVKDYRELVKSRLVARKVLEELELDDLTIEEFSGKLGVDLKNDTRVIQITARDIDPALATAIVNKVADVFQEKVVEVMQVENVKVIDRGEIPDKPVKPNKKMNIAIAFVLGLMVGFGIAVLLDYLDNTIKTPDDVKKYTDLPVIGTIPVFPQE